MGRGTCWSGRAGLGWDARASHARSLRNDALASWERYWGKMILKRMIKSPRASGPSLEMGM